MFGIDLWDASLAPALARCGGGRRPSFLSPCVLPIVPPYLAFMAGASIEEAADRRRPQLLGTAAFFVLGLSTVFLLLGLAASALGRALLAWQEQMTLLAGAVIVLFGLHFLGVLRIPLLNREARLEAQAKRAPRSAPTSSASPSPSAGPPASARCSAPSSRWPSRAAPPAAASCSWPPTPWASASPSC